MAERTNARSSRESSLSRKRGKPGSSSSQDNSMLENPEKGTKKKKPGSGAPKGSKSNLKTMSIRDHFASSDSPRLDKQQSTDDSMDSIAGSGVMESGVVGSGDEEEYTLKDVVKMLVTLSGEVKKMGNNMTDMSSSISNKLSVLTSEVEKLQAEIFDLKQENDCLSGLLQESEKKVTELESRIREQAAVVKIASERSNQNEQYTRLWNIKLLNIPEKSEGVETATDCEKLALKVFTDKLGLKDVGPADIDAAHRLGERRSDGTRPIIVRFASRKVRQRVIQNRRKLKGAREVIVDDLTKQNYTLFQTVSNHPGALKAWTSNGVIFALSLVDNRIKRITCGADVCAKLPVDSVPTESLRKRMDELSKRNAKWSSIFPDSFPNQSDRAVTKTKEVVNNIAREVASGWHQ